MKMNEWSIDNNQGTNPDKQSTQTVKDSYVYLMQRKGWRERNERGKGQSKLIKFSEELLMKFKCPLNRKIDYYIVFFFTVSLYFKVVLKEHTFKIKADSWLF